MNFSSSRPSEQTAKLVLWNPGVAALLGFVLTPVFGATIQALNWRRMGQKRRAFGSAMWAVFAFFSVSLVVGLGGAFGASDGDINGILRLMIFLENIIWYFSSARLQAKYIVQEMNGAYVKESWVVPACVFIIIAGSVSGLAEIGR